MTRELVCLYSSLLALCDTRPSVQVEGVRVTFLDANHCPGAAMILFEPPGRPPVLHSGDFR